jgi:phosphate starvation-inducible PhoH-like protein
MGAFDKADVLFLTGPAGTGKTHLAIALAARSITDKKYDRLILTRPQVTVADEQMGFLPGRIDQKMHPWLLPVQDVLRNMTHTPSEWLKAHAETCPLGFIRGRTFDHCIALLDEAQNCSYSQLKAFLSRLGRRGKLIVTGDMQQSDLRGDVPFRIVLDQLFSSPIPGVRWVKLGVEDIVRHPLVGQILERL